MFDDLVECSPTRKKTNKPWTVILSTVVQCAVLGFLVRIPWIYPEALPTPILTTLLVAPPPPPPPPPPPAAAPVKIVKPVARLIQAGKLTAPRAIPKEVNIIKEQEMPPDMGAVGVAGGVPGGVPGGQAGGVLGGIIGGVGSSLPPPPKATPTRIRVGGQVQQASLISQPKPVYPALARQARIQGVGRLQAVLTKEVAEDERQGVAGLPPLRPSAVEARRQWRYKPTLLHGEPVEVITTIGVNFVLGS